MIHDFLRIDVLFACGVRRNMIEKIVKSSPSSNVFFYLHLFIKRRLDREWNANILVCR